MPAGLAPRSAKQVPHQSCGFCEAGWGPGPCAASSPTCAGSPASCTRYSANSGWPGAPKTSGGNGLHVYVRIEPRWGFADLRRAAYAFAREVERRAPGEVTTTWWRKDRDPTVVFVDYNQNARDHTIASAHSVP